MNEDEPFTVRASPVKFTVEKDDVEYEFEPIEEVTDLAKLKKDVIDIMRRFKIVIRAKNIITMPKSSPSTSSLEDDYLRSKEIIREWYRESPDKEWRSGELMEAAKFPKARRSQIIMKLTRERFIKCTNPTEARNMRKYVKAEAMITPEAIEKRDMETLLLERKLVREG